ncbi:MAG: hypothetical protein AB8E15_06540 [Bdellovibrionales bacterium]
MKYSIFSLSLFFLISSFAVDDDYGSPLGSHTQSSKKYQTSSAVKGSEKSLIDDYGQPISSDSNGKTTYKRSVYRPVVKKVIRQQDGLGFSYMFSTGLKSTSQSVGEGNPSNRFQLSYSKALKANRALDISFDRSSFSSEEGLFSQETEANHISTRYRYHLESSPAFYISGGFGIEREVINVSITDLNENKSLIYATGLLSAGFQHHLESILLSLELSYKQNFVVSSDNSQLYLLMGISFFL